VILVFVAPVIAALAETFAERSVVKFSTFA
jgi:hypothetical protein